MKKFVLVFVLCLYAGSARAEKTFDVDRLYETCNSAEYSANYKFCLGLFRGYFEVFTLNYSTEDYDTKCY